MYSRAADIIKYTDWEHIAYAHIKNSSDINALKINCSTNFLKAD